MRMKSFLIVMATLVSASSLIAACVTWDMKKPPPVTIVEGHSKALAALAEQSDRYHCVGAKIDCSSWVYEFASPTAESKWVWIHFNGSTEVRNHPVVLH